MPSPGESQYYTDIPTWVDGVYSAEIIMDQYDYYGTYQGGFINSLFGQKNVTVTTEGYNYIAANDDVYVYTGVTSAGSDESNIGFYPDKPAHQADHLLFHCGRPKNSVQ